MKPLYDVRAVDVHAQVEPLEVGTGQARRSAGS